MFGYFLGDLIYSKAPMEIQREQTKVTIKGNRKYEITAWMSIVKEDNYSTLASLLKHSQDSR